MIRLETLNDVAAQSGKLQGGLANLIALRMREVIAAFADAGAEWTAEEYGPFVVLEAEDNARDFNEVGLNPEEQGLLGAVWEAATRHPAEGVWEVLILFGGDAGLTVFIPDASWLDPALRAKLKTEADLAFVPAEGAGGDRAPF